MADVPQVPGVPPLASYAPVPGVEFLTADAASILAGAPQQWGLFLNGTPVIVADTVTSFEYLKDSTIADYPIEQGSFESYNKVPRPIQAHIRFTSGGSVQNRQALLASAAAIADDLNVYDAVTPEAIYPNVNVIHQNYDREAQTVGLLSLDMIVQEVRQAGATAAAITGTGASSSLSDTSSQNSADPVSGGNVQALTPSALQSAAASGSIPDLTTQ